MAHNPWEYAPFLASASPDGFDDSALDQSAQKLVDSRPRDADCSRDVQRPGVFMVGEVGHDDIFTMGEDSVEAQKRIDELTEAIEKCKSSIASARNQAADAEKEIRDIEGKEADAYWEIKATMPPAFKPAEEDRDSDARRAQIRLAHAAPGLKELSSARA